MRTLPRTATGRAARSVEVRAFRAWPPLCSLRRSTRRRAPNPLQRQRLQVAQRIYRGPVDPHVEPLDLVRLMAPEFGGLAVSPAGWAAGSARGPARGRARAPGARTARASAPEPARDRASATDTARV